MTPQTSTDNRSAHGYSYTSHQRKLKVDWAGISLGDAFRENLPYWIRLQAQGLFYREVRRAQASVAEVAGDTVDFKPQVAPQLSPCYTTYPSSAAVQAAIGLTAYLEFKSRVEGGDVLHVRLKEMREQMLEHVPPQVNMETFQSMSRDAIEAVQNRVFLALLSRGKTPHHLAVEAYRLFAAAQVDLRATNTQEMVNVAVLFGDLLPPLDAMPMHQIVRRLMETMSARSGEFSARLDEVAEHELLDIGEEWATDLCQRIARLLQQLGHERQERERKVPTKKPDTSTRPGDSGKETVVPPLDEPLRPFLMPEEHTVAQEMSRVVDDIDDLAEEEKQTIKEFSEAMESAVSEQRSWENIRPDVLERKLRIEPFQEGPISGSPTDGHEMEVAFGNGETGKGLVFDRALELVDDPLTHAQLLEDARPLTEALHRLLYPHIRRQPVLQRFRSSGSIDPGRLPLSGVSDAVYRRYPVVEAPDRRGGALLVLACDGSGSLDREQIRMLKLLVTAWLTSTARSDVQILAGIYHSGDVPGLCHDPPLVQWLNHPRKTPAFSPPDAVRGLLSLECGSGVQRDALQLSFILDEAVQIARGRMIYLVVISDTCWNKSFQESRKSAAEEVEGFFASAYDRLPEQLHVTLVALAPDTEETGFEKTIDQVVTVSAREIQNPESVAARIGVYVTSQIRAGRRKPLTARG